MASNDSGITECEKCGARVFPDSSHIVCFEKTSDDVSPSSNNLGRCPFECCTREFPIPEADQAGHPVFPVCCMCIQREKVLRESNIEPSPTNRQSSRNTLAIDVLRSTWFCKECSLNFCEADHEIHHEQDICEKNARTAIKKMNCESLSTYDIVSSNPAMLRVKFWIKQEHAKKLPQKLEDDAKKLTGQVIARAGQDNEERQPLVYPQGAALASPPNTNPIGTLTTTKSDDYQGESEIHDTVQQLLHDL